VGSQYRVKPDPHLQFRRGDLSENDTIRVARVGDLIVILLIGKASRRLPIEIRRCNARF